MRKATTSNSNTTMQSTQAPEPEDKNGNLSGIDRYVRRLFQDPDFPQLNKEGKVYFIKTNAGSNKGRPRKDAITFVSGNALQGRLRKLFPIRGVHFATDPFYRATFHRKKVGNARSFFRPGSAASVDSWDPERAGIVSHIGRTIFNQME